MKSILSRLWSFLVNWFEHSDLVPLLVLVSAVHYAAVLNGKDAWPVAVAIGLLVDLGHYRTIRAAVRYSGSFRQAVLRWTIAIGMTALSLNYHERYYQDWWLSAPLPLLIAALAWLKQVDSKTGPRSERVTVAVEPATAKPVLLEAKAKPATAELPAGYVCSCGYPAKTQAGLNAHQRVHSNGKAKISEVENVG